MRTFACVIGAWCLVTASALAVVWAVPSTYQVRVTHVIEGSVDFDLQADLELDTGGRIDVVPRPVVIRGLEGLMLP